MGKSPCRRTIAALCAVLLALTLAACGGSTAGGASQSASGGQTAILAATGLSGIAAAGAPLLGTVQLSDASFPSKSAAAVITQDGTFSFSATDLAGLKAPFLLKAADASGNTWYSFAGGAGSANINPLTSLALAASSGCADLQGLSALFLTHNAASLNVLPQAFPRALSQVMAELKPLLSIYGAAGADPLAGFYPVNGQGFDGFLAQVDLAISQGSVTLTDRTSLATVFSAPLNNLGAGVATVSALSAPAPSYLPGNAILTLAAQGSLPSGTALQSGSFTLQLPLGITVDTGPAGINTAVPLIPQTTVYPAPVLSQSNNQLSVSFSSLKGFGTGNFLTIRCLVTTAALFASTAADFSVSAASLYGDIYKSQRVQGISIVPVAIVYPTREGKNLFDSLCASCHNLGVSDTTTASLYGKSDQLPAEFTSLHHGEALTATQLDYLSEYLTALFGGQLIF